VARQRCKTLFPYRFASFSVIYRSFELSNSVSCLASTFTLERYGPRLLAQHVNDGENVMVTFVEMRVWMHLDDISCHRSSYPRTMARLLGKFFLVGACNFSTSRSFSVLTIFPSDPMFRAQLSIRWRIITSAMKIHYDLFHFERYLLYVYVVFVVRIAIFFF